MNKTNVHSIARALLFVAAVALASVLITVPAEAAQQTGRQQDSYETLAAGCGDSDGVPSVTPRTDGRCSMRAFDGANSYRRAVQNVDRNCGDMFCYIIDGPALTYFVIFAWNCDRFNVAGHVTADTGPLYARNNGSGRIVTYDQNGRVLGDMAGGETTNVNWDPVYSFRTCG